MKAVVFHDIGDIRLEDVPEPRLSIVGVYPPTMTAFPIGEAMMKYLTINLGNCNHRTYVPHLIELVRTGAIDPAAVLTRIEPGQAAIDAYETFDRRESGWTKVALEPIPG